MDRTEWRTSLGRYAKREGSTQEVRGVSGGWWQEDQWTDDVDSSASCQLQRGRRLSMAEERLQKDKTGPSDLHGSHASQGEHPVPR